ncbi:MAG: hypothetical protein NVSMB4_17100 [Acidimicrobiales bacterium]
MPRRASPPWLAEIVISRSTARVVAEPRCLLIVHHSRTGGTAALLRGLVAGAAEGGGDLVPSRVVHAFDASAEDVLAAGIGEDLF